MKIFKIAQVIPLLVFSVLLTSCNQTSKKEDKNIEATAKREKAPTKPIAQRSEEFKKYWYGGTAEITSYTLEQARYGEIREGSAVLVYVTEPFFADQQVKADEHHPDNIPVLKLNSTKNFLTGIYPYSVMNSSFYPVSDQQHAIKLSTTVQEWCGHVYVQLNNREHFDVASFSYFASEGDQKIQLAKTHLENEIWNKIRIDPNNLPLGTITMIPSMEYLRFSHQELKAYEATASINDDIGQKTYTLHYPKLERTLRITFNTAFPYYIEGWTESYKSGFGPNAQILTSKASKIKTLNRAYWKENQNRHVFLRDSLGL
ncbi:septum formation inhibitor Maf [Arenibacter sp. 6A1]|uniref:septum formation inhibitor Maf n=1 Tax=Arenibacter sp. 6A1 TaxID=2720391 RepID=UPI001444C611|nr:septum formation inhibitor Maf [Arenibacter sp. 6A1]NKI26901.1 septum formation inhibitor Maf [Arenibacter sp. 6A1]